MHPHSKISSIGKLLKHDALSGILLFVALVAAFIVCNTAWRTDYQHFWQQSFGLYFGRNSFTQPVLFWVNEGLMTLFFFVVGLELKREFLTGELSEASQILFPLVAALGGMIVPILFYCLINRHNSIGLQGWAIPVATDIAFALGVLSLFGKRVPLPLRIFLLTLAIFDDVGAILIIAIFNTDTLSYISILLAILCLIVLGIFRILNVTRASFYLLIGALLWVCVLRSGVHATLTGILLSLMIPNTTRPDGSSLVSRMEDYFKPWVDFLVLPLFAFANAGISFYGVNYETLTSRIVLGIAVGLFIGKQLGVMGVVALFRLCKWVKFPENTNWFAFFGVAILCGIGFTMSLFLGTLAFGDNNAKLIVEARLGVLIGSALSALVGALILFIALRKPAPATI